MHLKITLSSRGLKLSNTKPRFRVAVLHFFREVETSNGFLTSNSILIQINVFFSFLFQDEPQFYIEINWKALESELGLEIFMLLADIGPFSQTTILTSIVYMG
jgi:hypothetical protein